MGSMNKMFTGVAVAQLVQAGKLKVIDPRGKYLTGYPMRTSPRRSRFSTVDPHRWNGRHLWSPIRGQPAEHARSERLRQALRQARSPVRARRAVGLQLWIHTVGSRGRKGFRTELLRLR